MQGSYMTKTISMFVCKKGNPEQFSMFLERLAFSFVSTVIF